MLAVLFTLLFTPPADAQDWGTYGGGPAHINFNGGERKLGPKRAKKLHLTWKVALNGVIDTQPTYASDVRAGKPKRRRDLVFAATEHGQVIAVDAHSGRTIWTRYLKRRHVSCYANTPDSVFGISAAPVIDRKRGSLYVIAADNALHALSLTTGKEVTGWPLRLGLPANSHHIWGSPTLVGQRMYVPIASYCDNGTYRGGVMLVNVAKRRITRTWYAVGPGSEGGSVWSWAGAPVDVADGNVYVATGNAIGPQEDIAYAEHVVRLTGDLTVLQADDPDVGVRADSDFGSAPLLFRPRGCPPLLAVIHKRGMLFLYRRHAIAAGPVQTVQIGDPNMLTASGTFAWSPKQQTVYVTHNSNRFHGMAALGVSNCRLNERWQVDLHREMWVPSPPTVANGVVYFGTGSDRHVLAVNARTGKVLWRSGTVIKGFVFAAPAVVKGRLFAVSWDRHLYAFGP